MVKLYVAYCLTVFTFPVVEDLGDNATATENSPVSLPDSIREVFKFLFLCSPLTASCYIMYICAR